MANLTPRTMGLLGLGAGMLTARPNYGAFSPGQGMTQGLNQYQAARNFELMVKRNQDMQKYREAMAAYYSGKTQLERDALEQEANQFNRGLGFAEQLMGIGQPNAAPQPAPGAAFPPTSPNQPLIDKQAQLIQPPGDPGADLEYLRLKRQMQQMQPPGDPGADAEYLRLKRQEQMRSGAPVPGWDSGAPYEPLPDDYIEETVIQEQKRPMQEGPRSYIGAAEERMMSDSLMKQGAALQFVPGFEDAGKAVQKWAEYLNDNRKWASEMARGKKKIDPITGHVIDEDEDRIYKLDANGKPTYISSEEHAKARNRNMKAGATQINTTVGGESYSKAFGKGLAEKDIKLMTDATVAAENIPKLNEILRELDSGEAVTGVLADLRKDMLRVIAFFDNEKAKRKVSDTEYLDALLGSDVFPQISALGIGARGLDTPAERDFLRQVMTGMIPMDRTTLVRLTEIRRNIALRQSRKWNTRVKTLPKRVLDEHGMTREELMIPVDDISESFIGGEPDDGFRVE